MSNHTITFIQEPDGSGISPSVGYNGIPYTVTGPRLGDVTGVSFINMFEDEYQSAFGIKSDTEITGIIPLLDGTVGPHKVRLTNEVGKDDVCCFYPYITASSSTPVIFNSQRQFVQYTYKQLDDKYGVNASINDEPTYAQGYEIIQVNAKAEHPSNLLEITCELSLQSDFWGAAVLTLYKDDEPVPRKAWNYQLLGLNMGQTAKLTYLTDAGDVLEHNWRIRLGRTHTSYATIYINRNVETQLPYFGKTSSYMSVAEIEKNQAQHVV